MKKITKTGLIIGIIAISALVYHLYPRNLDKSDKNNVENVEVVENENDNNNGLSENNEKQETTDPTDSVGNNMKQAELQKAQNKQATQQKEPLPASKKLEVAFIPQAPYHDWSEPWQNACEEAALPTLHHYIKGDKSISKETVKQEILAMIDWQIKNFGSHKDLKAFEIAQVAKEYLDYQNAKATYDITLEDIKKEIALGNPVIIPAAGRVLDNPNFTAPGPVYHNLVVIGYTENRIITNDPGTRLGANFEYTYNNFYESTHDFVDGAEKKNPAKILEGKKVMIIIEK